MIKNPNRILARISYIHTPPRCRKPRMDSINVYGLDESEARKKINAKALSITLSSTKVTFTSDITYQHARVETNSNGFDSQSFDLLPSPGVDGCTTGTLDIHHERAVR